MNQTTRQILEKRKAEIQEKLGPAYDRHRGLRYDLAQLEEQIRELHAEFDAVEIAIKALEAQKPRPNITIMQAVLKVLETRPDGMTAQEILAEINTQYFNGRIVRPSLSPQLSRLKDRDGKIELKGNKWFLLPQEPQLFNRQMES